MTRILNLFGSEPQIRRRNISFRCDATVVSFTAPLFYLGSDHVRVLCLPDGQVRQSVGNLIVFSPFCWK